MKKKIQLKKEVISQLDDARLLQIKGGTAAGTDNCPESDAYGHACRITAANEVTCCAQSGCLQLTTINTSGPMLCVDTLHTCNLETLDCPPASRITICNSVINCSLPKL